MSVHQCMTCQHRQRRGGIVLKAAWQCVVLEGEDVSDRLASIVTGMARLLARQNQCPTYSPYPLRPDAYMAEDLPIDDATGA